MNDGNRLFFVKGFVSKGWTEAITLEGNNKYKVTSKYVVAESPKDAINQVFEQLEQSLLEYQDVIKSLSKAKCQDDLKKWLEKNPDKEALLNKRPPKPVRRADWQAEEVQVPGYEVLLKKKDGKGS